MKPVLMRVTNKPTITPKQAWLLVKCMDIMYDFCKDMPECPLFPQQYTDALQDIITLARFDPEFKELE